MDNIIEINSIEEFLAYMFDGTLGHVEIMFMGANKIPSVKTYPTTTTGWKQTASKRIKLISQYENCYFGVCPRVEAIDKHAREDIIIDVPVLWADIDGKMLNVTLEEQLSEIMNSPIKPTLVIMSGNGYHCYWKLGKVFRISNVEEKAYIKGIIKGITQTVNGDHTFNLDRVLRIPFTSNLKDKKNPKKVEIIHFDPSLIYNITDLESYKVELSIDEVTRDDDPSRVFKKLLLEDMEEHKELVKKAHLRIEPHMRKAAKTLKITDEQAALMLKYLMNGEIDFDFEDCVESDFDINDGTARVYWEDQETTLYQFDADVLKVVKHMNKLKLKSNIRDKVIINELPNVLQSKIIRGTFKGGRSGLDYMVITELRQLGYTPTAIKELYEDERYRIGDKYRERDSNKNYYLSSVISSADRKLKG